MDYVLLKQQKGANEMKRGFTLIEILIVIAVIAILAGISLPYMKGMQDEGNTAKAAGELRTLATAVESFYIHNRRSYPVQTTGVDSAWQSDANSLTTASPTIIRSVLYDPFVPGGSTEYRYATSASSGSQYYVIFSVGPDNTADITGINTSGVVQPTDRDDDIYISNGTSGTGGF
jgi:type II secretion system protein G